MLLHFFTFEWLVGQCPSHVCVWYCQPVYLCVCTVSFHWSLQTQTIICCCNDELHSVCTSEGGHCVSFLNKTDCMLYWKRTHIFYLLNMKFHCVKLMGGGGGVSCACIFRVLYMALAWLLIHCCYVILQHDCRVWTLDLLCRHTASPSVGKDLLSLCSSIQSIAFYKEREH